jgi:hypothetical protein
MTKNQLNSQASTIRGASKQRVTRQKSASWRELGKDGKRPRTLGRAKQSGMRQCASRNKRFHPSVNLGICPTFEQHLSSLSHLALLYDFGLNQIIQRDRELSTAFSGRELIIKGIMPFDS